MPDDYKEDYKVEYEGKATATVKKEYDSNCVNFFGFGGDPVISINTNTGDVYFWQRLYGDQSSYRILGDCESGYSRTVQLFQRDQPPNTACCWARFLLEVWQEIGVREMKREADSLDQGRPSQDSCHEGVSHKVLEAAGHYFCWRCGKRIRWENPMSGSEIDELKNYLKIWEAQKLKAQDEQQERFKKKLRQEQIFRKKI